jgi:hypothetical protein
MNPRIRTIIALVIIISWLVGGCSKLSGDVIPVQAPSTLGHVESPIVQPQLPTMSLQDAHSDNIAIPRTITDPAEIGTPVSSVADVVGAWAISADESRLILTFNADGTYQLGYPYFLRTYLSHGTFDVADGRLEWLTASDCHMALNATYEVYRQSSDDQPSQLTFRLVGNDDCWMRAQILQHAPLAEWR